MLRPCIEYQTTRMLFYLRNRRYVLQMFFLFFYVAAKATYIRLLHDKIAFWFGFSALAPYTGVGPI